MAGPKADKPDAPEKAIKYKRSMALEDSFGITINDDEATKLSTVSAIVDYLEKLQ